MNPGQTTAPGVRRPRVLVVLNSFVNDGPGNLMFQVIRRLAADGDLDIEVSALSRGGDLLFEFRRIGVRAEFVNTRGILGPVRLRTWARRHGTGNGGPPDVVHTNLLWPDLMARLVLDQLGGPVLTSTIHGLHAVREKGVLLGAGYQVLDRATRQRTVRFVAISEHVRTSMIAAGYPAERVVTIRNGVDAVGVFPANESTRELVRELLDIPEGGALVVQAGQLIHRKSVRETLAGFAEVAGDFPRSVLAFIGEGPLRGELEAAARERGIADRVRFVGNLTAMLPKVLGSADAVLLPSRDEPFGLVIAEAMAAAAPVAVTAVGGLKDLVRDGETGVVLPSHEPGAIAAGLRLLLGDRERARRLADAGRDFVTLNFEVGRTADAYRRLWLSLLADPGQPNNSP